MNISCDQSHVTGHMRPIKYDTSLVLQFWGRKCQILIAGRSTIGSWLLYVLYVKMMNEGSMYYKGCWTQLLYLGSVCITLCNAFCGHCVYLSRLNGLETFQLICDNQMAQVLNVTMNLLYTPMLSYMLIWKGYRIKFLICVRSCYIIFIESSLNSSYQPVTII